jgi:protoporphyrinogen IX oxidase
MIYILPLHIIFVVTWFAGLFYIVRLFIYHTEAEKKPEPERTILQNQYKIMERNLWYIITWPSMILTYVFGSILLYHLYGMNIPPWLIVKLMFVFGLTLYHLQNHAIYRKLAKNKITWTSTQLRLWNELATIFLVPIIFIVIIGDVHPMYLTLYPNAGEEPVSPVWGIVGFLSFAFLLWGAVMIYKKAREKKSKN